MHDLVFRNALLLDGTGAPGALGDLAVRDGRIAELGRVETAGRQEVDASGLALMPGQSTEVYIKTSERTALEFLLEPLTSGLRRSFKEH